MYAQIAVAVMQERERETAIETQTDRKKGQTDTYNSDTNTCIYIYTRMSQVDYSKQSYCAAIVSSSVIKQFASNGCMDAQIAVAVVQTPL